jgi:hypothetical protein
MPVIIPERCDECKLPHTFRFHADGSVSEVALACAHWKPNGMTMPNGITHTYELGAAHTRVFYRLLTTAHALADAARWVCDASDEARKASRDALKELAELL